MVKIKAIVAVNNKGYIGKDGKLMWRSKDDLKHFKEKTSGHICIVGRKTFENDLGGKELPNRKFFVVGSNYLTPAQALSEATKLANETGKDIWVIGGKQIYDVFLPFCGELHISRINNDDIGDVVFHYSNNFVGLLFNYNFETNN